MRCIVHCVGEVIARRMEGKKANFNISVVY